MEYSSDEMVVWRIGCGRPGTVASESCFCSMRRTTFRPGDHLTLSSTGPAVFAGAAAGAGVSPALATGDLSPAVAVGTFGLSHAVSARAQATSVRMFVLFMGWLQGQILVRLVRPFRR